MRSPREFQQLFNTTTPGITTRLLDTNDVLRQTFRAIAPLPRPLEAKALRLLGIVTPKERKPPKPLAEDVKTPRLDFEGPRANAHFDKKNQLGIILSLKFG